MNQLALNELAESIRSQGIMQPIVVRAVGIRNMKLLQVKEGGAQLKAAD